MHASEIRELLKLVDQPDIVSFAGGLPDPSLFPISEIGAAYAEILGSPSLAAAALQYSVSEGHLPLRRWIVDHMATLGVPCDVDNIVVTSGSQQGLDFIAKLFLSKGDTALVQEPTYLGALQAFNSYEPRYDVVSAKGAERASALSDSAGMNGGRVAFSYVIPDFANPSGETLTQGERRRMLAVSTELGVPLIEDGAYEALRFSGDRVPACAALELERCGTIERSRVIYLGTFSKTISPGLRVGWICAASEVVRKIVLAKQGADLHSPTLNQMVMHRVAEAIFDIQVEKLIPAYRKRRNAMLASLEAHMPEPVTWSKPDGGMFVWVTLPNGMDAAEQLTTLLAEEKIGFVPGAAFSPNRTIRNTIRLNYSLQSETSIFEGVGRLSALVARQVQAR